MEKRKASFSYSPTSNPSKHYRSESNRYAEYAAIAQYTVGWICALEEEYTCACRMLDEELHYPGAIGDSDDNTYVFGRIKEHYVVIGCLPAGRYGTNSAARVARDMVRTFPNLRFALMVGIGGGAPTLRNDVRLGDVVVSMPGHGFGGVIQYDLGRRLQDGRYLQTGQLNAPPDKLLSVMTEVRRLHNDKQKPDRIAEHVKRMSDMTDYQRPVVDQLYQTHYLHPEGTTCEQCDPTALVERPERQYHRLVHIHHGTIASGNTVLKDAIMRDAYVNDPHMNILCFEMEAAGLMNNVPCLVIRGVCDYCDSHKNDDWHKYAALTAAAYARELLLLLRPQRVISMPPWAGQVAHELQQISQNIATLVESQNSTHTQVDSVDQKIVWGKLSSAKGAEFDSYENQHDECLPGTRTELLHRIDEWTRSLHGKCIFWLSGMAGTGKSTILITLSRYLKSKQLLGASFFFKRGEEDRGNAKKLFPTLIQQLALSVPQLASSIRKVIEDNPYIAEKALNEQFDKLLLQPLLELDQDQDTTIIIVIDALDECEREADIQAILQLLPQVQKLTSVQLRFFLTSRPELGIQLGFKDISGDHQNLVLHEIPAQVLEHDISLFLKHKFSQIQKERSLPLNWPGEPNIHTLFSISVPLFISAATICRFIKDLNWDPEMRLAAILRDQANYASKMGKTYLPILNQLLTGQGKRESERMVQEFHNTVGFIILLHTPLPIKALAKLLGIEDTTVSSRLRLLHSVLSIPVEPHLPVRLLHLSFRDFLLDPDIEDTRFWVEKEEKHQGLLNKCLSIMRHSLKKNICNLSSYGTRRVLIDTDSVQLCLPLELQYSCRYWVHHLIECKDPVAELDNVFSFLKDHFLHWVEAMSILGIVAEVIGLIELLETITKGGGASDFLRDAKRFTLRNRQMADIAPLQLYISGLIFAPSTSIIKWEFARELPEWLQKLPSPEGNWGAELQTFKSLPGEIQSVAFSADSDSRLLLSLSYRDTVIIWDRATGSALHTINGCSAAFLLDCQYLVSGSKDGTVTLWDIATRAALKTFVVHQSEVTSFAVSQIGQLLAVACDDGKIKLWGLDTWVEKQELGEILPYVDAMAFSPDGLALAFILAHELLFVWDIANDAELINAHGLSCGVRCVTFSPDGELLASGEGGTIHLWSTVTWTVLHNLHVDFNFETVTSIAFLPDRLLVSGSSDGTIKFWDIVSAAKLQTLRGHLSHVSCVSVSWDYEVLASGDDDGTIKLWELVPLSKIPNLGDRYCHVQPAGLFRSNQTQQSAAIKGTNQLSDTYTGLDYRILEGHTEYIRCMALSPDGQLLASGSNDSTVKLWDIATGLELQSLDHEYHHVWSVVYSPDSRLLASGVDRGAVRIWDVATGAKLHDLIVHRDISATRYVAFSPDGLLLASACKDGSVKLWDTATGLIIHTLEAESGTEPVSTFLPDSQVLSFSPDSRMLASTFENGAVKVWNTAVGSRLMEKCHTKWKWDVSVAFSPDSTLLAGQFEDGTIKIWDTGTWTELQSLGLTDIISTLSFSSEALRLRTNLGYLDIEPWYDINTSTSAEPDCDIFVRESRWVAIGDQEVLWLPPEYQPSCFKAMRHILALGHASGRISFIRFSF
ncbi:quinon protein alcohol dehydrogenase-like superfamily [Aspergillus californicus]